MPEAATYKFLQHLLEASIGFRVCRTELWNVSPTWTGWQASTAHHRRDAESTDARRISRTRIARWSQVAQYPGR